MYWTPFEREVWLTKSFYVSVSVANFDFMPASVYIYFKYKLRNVYIPCYGMIAELLILFHTSTAVRLTSLRFYVCTILTKFTLRWHRAMNKTLLHHNEQK